MAAGADTTGAGDGGAAAVATAAVADGTTGATAVSTLLVVALAGVV